MGKETSGCEQAISSAVAETLENMVFMEVCKVPAEQVAPAEHPLMEASLLILDPLPGELKLVMPQSLARQIAEAIYALPAEELTEHILGDLLSEIINIIAGRFMNELLPKQQLYRLGLPEINESVTGELDMPEAEWHFRVEEERFSVRVLGKALLQG